jgi:membrane protein
MTPLRTIPGMLKDAAGRWSDDQCYRLGASLSYYALFSLFPLMLISVTGVGFLLGHDASIHNEILDAASRTGAPALSQLLDETLTSMETHRTARGVGALVGIVTLVFSASAVFSELESALNRIWRVTPPQEASLWQTIRVNVRDKLVSFLIVLGAAVALLVMVFVGTMLSALDRVAGDVVHDPYVWLAVDAAVSLALLTGFFAAIFHTIPQTEIAWRDVFGGAFLTALIFTCMKRVLSWYFGHIGSYAAYGAVGGILGLLSWIYLASLILLFGAEVTRVYAERFGSLASPPAVDRASRALTPCPSPSPGREAIQALTASKSGVLPLPPGGRGQG